MSVARAAARPSWAGPLTCAIQLPAAIPEKADAQTCERSMADVVSKSRIEFASASYEMAQRNAPTLNA